MTPEERVAEIYANYDCDEPPGEILAGMIADAIRAAAAEERERAANVAYAFGAGFDAAERDGGAAVCPRCGAYARNLADEIGDRIREGK